MMLMKTPTSGASASGFSRDVVFRLSLAPDPNSTAVGKAFGDSMTQIQNRVASTAQLRAKDISGFYRSAFDEVLRHGTSVFEALSMKSRQMSQQMASDWANSMRGVSGGSGGVAIPGRFSMNMGALAASRPPVYAPSPWPTMGGSSSWAPPSGMMGLGPGVPAWQTTHSYPSFAGSPDTGGGGMRGGGAAATGTAFRRGAEGFNNIFHGGMHLARGFAYSGMAGEDPQKVLDTLLRIEGTLGLIYGAVSIGKGISSLGGLGGAAGIGGLGMAGIAAAVAGVAIIGGAAYEARDEGKTRNLGKDPTRPGFFARLQRNPFSDLTAGNWWTGNGQDTGEAIFQSDRSYDRALRQKKAIQDANMARDERMKYDAQEAASGFAGLDRSHELRMRGVRGDSGRFSVLGGLLGEERQNELRLVEKMNEAARRGGIEAEQAAARREEAAMRIYNIEEQQREIIVRAANEAAAAADREVSKTREILNIRQQALLSSSGRYGSDLARFGGMNQMERYRVQFAAQEVRAGRGTEEHRRLLEGFNEFRPLVEQQRQAAGFAAGGGTLFAGGLGEANRDYAAAVKADLAHVAAQVNLVSKYEVAVKADASGTFMDDMKDAMEVAIKEMDERRKKDRLEIIEHVKSELAKRDTGRRAVAK